MASFLASITGSLRTFVLLGALFLALMFAGLSVAPDPVRASAAPGQFDAHAARERMERLLGDETPHPVDSAAQDVVRDALLREIAALGFTPEVRDTFACRPQPRGPLIDCARVRNIIFSIGPTDAPAVLAAAHYDSVPAAPGASDDGLGLSVWLEVARLMSNEQLTRRVVFLFSDGEEPALLGAHVFATSDPLMQSVESFVNLEARGTRGPAVFFESNQPNADSVAAYAAVPRPLANSVMADVYALLSNSTDVTAITRPGLDVINIALLDGVEDYHTPQDTIASQDLRSVQHMGDVALAVTRRLASASNADNATPMVYTDIASRGFVYAPSWAGQAALAFCALVALFAFWRSGSTDRWRALATPVVAILVAAALSFALGFLMTMLRRSESYAFAHPEPTRAWAILLAILGAALALLILRPERNAAQLSAAATFWFALIGGVTSIFVNGISILYALPALAFALAWLVSLAWKPAVTIGAWLAGLVALTVWAPMIYLVELALGLDMPVVMTVLVALLLLTWIGAIVQTQGEGRWWGVAAVTGAATLAAFVVSALTPAITEARPRSLNINYFLNTTENDARVLAGTSARALPSELRDAFQPETIFPGDLTDTWAASALVEQIAAPTLREITVAEAGGERVVSGRLAMGQAYRALIRIPVTTNPLRVRINGVDVSFADTGGGEGAEYMTLACQGRACDGATVEIVLAADGAAGEWLILGQFPGFDSPSASALQARRPASATPIQFGDGAITLSRFAPF